MKEYLLNQLNNILMLAEDVVEYKNEESVHDFRVALRRFLAIYNILKKQTEIPLEILSYIDTIKEIRGSTNNLRDLEVLKSHIQPLKFTTDFGEKGKDTLLIILDQKIKQEHDKVLNILLNAQIKEKIEKLSIFFNSLDININQISYLKKFLKKIRKCHKSDLNDETIHVIRIQFKKIRYLLESLNSHEDKIEMIKSVQDLLGNYNDYRIGINILRSILEEKITLTKNYLYIIGFAEALFLFKKDELKDKIILESKTILKEIRNIC